MTQNKKPIIVFTVLLGIGTVLFLIGGVGTPMKVPSPTVTATTPATVRTQATSTSSAVTADKDASQVIHIMVKGGYSPSLSHAKAGKPLRLDMETNNTYDCSSSINIPALHFRKFLPATGVTAIDIPPQEKGSTLTVLCAMGMYSFDIQFD